MPIRRHDARVTRRRIETMRSRLGELAAAFRPRKLCSTQTAGYCRHLQARLSSPRLTRRARARAHTLWRRICMLVHNFAKFCKRRESRYCLNSGA
eukprot:6214102-Pleurochrysis_carterae.AAC.2